jgi:lantibiotic biosynthesis protein
MSDSARPLYEPADFFVVRAPLLSLDAYRTLQIASDTDGSASLSAAARRALAVASPSLLDAQRAIGSKSTRSSKVTSALLRYMTRMSTRPTPFGLFAGVAIGTWADSTGLTLAAAPRRQRTRPDMEWLMNLVIELESIPEVRRQLRVVANSAALVRAGRVFLAEQTHRGQGAAAAVSVRATQIVRRALSAARQPIRFDELAARLLTQTPGATAEQVNRLLTELWLQTLLLTDLRPPLTVESPARHVVDRLSDVPAAAAARERIQTLLDEAALSDRAAIMDRMDRHDALVTKAAKIRRFERSALQVDSAVELADDHVSRRVGEETATAAELLLRLSPHPRGPAHLAMYRRQFVHRYGAQREVPLLELLDPNFGLGQLPGEVPAVPANLDPQKARRRAQALQELATNALHERTSSVVLDDAMIERLETWEANSRAPWSLDLYVSVAAPSKAHVRSGDFAVVVEPNVGAMSAGRALGRFADFVAGSNEALRRLAMREEASRPDVLFAELAYQPRALRLGNVSIRPNVRAYELAVGVSSGRDAAHTIALDELVVGVYEDRFRVRWTANGREVVPTAGHMLRSIRGPAVCRFLSEVARDGCCQLTGFHWGGASTFPFLPRVCRGRIVLSLAQWRYPPRASHDLAVHRREQFFAQLQRWREAWQVPQHVYLTAGDNRLLIDLDRPEQADEIRRALRARRLESVLLTEVFPDFDRAWVLDTHQRQFFTELVIPLVTRAPAISTDSAANSVPRLAERSNKHPLGSEWLYVKLYVARALEDDVLAGSARELIAKIISRGVAEQWFFVRYSDPEPHVRIRFRGAPHRLIHDLLPLLTDWTNSLMEHGSVRRFALDTYEQETERFGGPAGMRAAEALFAADSQAVLDLLEMTFAEPRLVLDTGPAGRWLLAVLTVDALLDGCGLDGVTRLEWCRARVRSRHEASREYRQWKASLRRLLADPQAYQSVPAGIEFAAILDRLRDAGAAFARTIDELETRSRLTRPASEIYRSVVHLHLNRFLGRDGAEESRVIALLWRLRQGLHPPARERAQ